MWLAAERARRDENSALPEDHDNAGILLTATEKSEKSRIFKKADINAALIVLPSFDGGQGGT